MKPRDPLARLSMAEIERRLGLLGRVRASNLSSRDRRLQSRLQQYAHTNREGA